MKIKTSIEIINDFAKWLNDNEVDPKKAHYFGINKKWIPLEEIREAINKLKWIPLGRGLDGEPVVDCKDLLKELELVSKNCL